jgi:hypothetical protein
MMAKALLDGLFFPLRISFALARCICGQELEFDDLGSIIDHKRWKSLKWLRQAISTGTPISDAEWMENLRRHRVRCRSRLPKQMRLYLILVC